MQSEEETESSMIINDFEGSRVERIRGQEGAP